MNLLNGLRVYLSGPIEFCKDAGTKWRDYITPFLESLGCVVLDPTKMSNDIPEQERVSRFNAYRDAKDYQSMYELASLTRQFDLRLIDACDYVIALVDQNVSMCGTWEELAMATDQRKPILLVWIGTRDAGGNVKAGVEAMNSWGFAQFKSTIGGKYRGHEYVFSNFDEVKARLTALDNGDYPMDSRWVIFTPGGLSRVRRMAPPETPWTTESAIDPFDTPNSDRTEALEVFGPESGYEVDE